MKEANKAALQQMPAFTGHLTTSDGNTRAFAPEGVPNFAQSNGGFDSIPSGNYTPGFNQQQVHIVNDTDDLAGVSNMITEEEKEDEAIAKMCNMKLCDLTGVAGENAVLEK